MSKGTSPQSLSNPGSPFFSAGSAHEGQITPKTRMEEAPESPSTLRGLRNRGPLKSPAKPQDSYFESVQSQTRSDQDTQSKYNFNNTDADLSGLHVESPRRINLSSVDLGSSLHRASILEAESQASEQELQRTAQHSPEDTKNALNRAESSGSESALSSKATSISGSFTRMTHRGKHDKRMFDKSGAPLINIDLERKEGPRPYSFQELREKAESELRRHAACSQPQSEQEPGQETHRSPAREPLEELSQDQVPRSRQERRKRRSSISQQPSPRPWYPRATSSESTCTLFTRQLTIKDIRGSETRKSDSDATMNTSKKSSVANLSLGESQPSGHQKILSRSSLRKSATHNSSEDWRSRSPSPSSRISSTAPASDDLSSSAGPVQAQKPKGSFARFFSRSVVGQLEGNTPKEGHSTDASSPKSKLFGGRLRFGPGKRSSRSSEVLPEISRKGSDDSFADKAVISSPAVPSDTLKARLTPQRPSAHLFQRASGNPLHQRSTQAPSGHLQTSFPATEAQRLMTPPIESSKVQEYYFDFFGIPKAPSASSPTFDSDDSPVGRHSVMTPMGQVDKLSRRKASAMPLVPSFHVRVDEDDQQQDTEEKTGQSESEMKPAVFAIDVPDHLPASPLCPLNIKRSNGTRLICPLHGRKKSPSASANNSRYL